MCTVSGFTCCKHGLWKLEALGMLDVNCLPLTGKAECASSCLPNLPVSYMLLTLEAYG